MSRKRTEKGLRGGAPTVLWWGRSDLNYSRNRVLLAAFRELGWEVNGFFPRVSAVGSFEAALCGLPRPDLVWLPCFRQRDYAQGIRLGRRWGVPCVADPLISAYDKQVNERKKYEVGSSAAVKLRAAEGRLLRSADALVADTDDHRRYFVDVFGLDEDRVFVVPVGAEGTVFVPSAQVFGELVDVLFYGSFLGLHSPLTIIEAARLSEGKPIRWTLLGDGPLKREAVEAARGLGNVRFEDPVAYERLAVLIGEANILLGVFGGSGKAGRVVPNKVHQALACGRPVVTRDSSVYPDSENEAGLCLVPAEDPRALCDAVVRLSRSREGLSMRGESARAYYDRWFSPTAVRDHLKQALDALGLGTLG